MVKEHLVRIKVEKDNNFIDLYRESEGGAISLCSKEHCANLPDLTGLQTTELFALLEPLGDMVEFPGDPSESNYDPSESNYDQGVANPAQYVSNSDGGQDAS